MPKIHDAKTESYFLLRESWTSIELETIAGCDGENNENLCSDWSCMKKHHHFQTKSSC